MWNLFFVSKNAVNAQLFHAWCVYVVRHRCDVCLKTFNFTFLKFICGVCKSSFWTKEKKKEFLMKMIIFFFKKRYFLIMFRKCRMELFCVVREWWIFYVILSFWVWHNFTCCHGLIMILSIFFFCHRNFSEVNQMTSIEIRKKIHLIPDWIVKIIGRQNSW